MAGDDAFYGSKGSIFERDGEKGNFREIELKELGICIPSSKNLIRDSKQKSLKDICFPAQDSAILWENLTIINSAGRTTAIPISIIIRPSRMSFAVIVFPNPTAT